MSSFLCFLCHSIVNADTNEEIREKYSEVVGMHLCMDSHLCYICCHVLNKLWLFRAICLKRSLEYPVLSSEQGTLYLQRNDIELQTICPEDLCGQFHNKKHSRIFHMTYEDTGTMNSQEYVDNEYVKLEHERTDFDEYFRQEKASPKTEIVQESNTEIFDDSINNSPDKNINKGAYKNFYDNTDHDQNWEQDRGMMNDDNGDQNLDTEDHTDNLINGCDDIGGDVNIDTNDANYNVFENEYIIPESIENNGDTNKVAESKEIIKKKKVKKNKKSGFEKITLTLEEQKMELDRRRKEKKYLEAEFKCYNCALGFLFKDTYQTHMMRHEESNGEYRCTTCSLRFASPAVRRAHVANHAERYRCARCGRRVLPRARTTHARACWGARAYAVACHLCGGMFQDGAGLQQHLKRFHRTQASTRSYSCSVCGNMYSNQAAVRTHMIKHINRKFDCADCASTFSSPYTLAQHKKKKHGEITTEQFPCEICNIVYSSRKSLLAHKRNSLNHQQTVLECPVCSRICPNQRSLSSHMESVHSGIKNYACGECGARYSNRKSLVRHEGSHRGKGAPRPAVCQLCGSTFKGNNKLNRHLREVCKKVKLEEELANLYGQNCINPG